MHRFQGGVRMESGHLQHRTALVCLCEFACSTKAAVTCARGSVSNIESQARPGYNGAKYRFLFFYCCASLTVRYRITVLL